MKDREKELKDEEIVKENIMNNKVAMKMMSKNDEKNEGKMGQKNVCYNNTMMIILMMK